MAYLPQMYVDGMSNEMTTVKDKLILAWQNINQAGIYIEANQWADAHTVLALASTYGLQANYYMLWKPNDSYKYYEQLAMSWIRTHLNDTPTATVNMAAIISAMFIATFSEVSDYIGLQWAFQQILWDQPFFPDKYAEIVQALRT